MEDKENFLGIKMPDAGDVKNHVASGFLRTKPPLLFNRHAFDENRPVGYDILSIDELNSHRNKSRTMSGSLGNATSSNKGYRQAARWTNSKTGKSTPFRTIKGQCSDSLKRTLENSNVDATPKKLSRTAIPTARKESVKVEEMEKAGENEGNSNKLEQQGVPSSKDCSSANDSFSSSNRSWNKHFHVQKNEISNHPVWQSTKVSDLNGVQQTKISTPLPSFQTLKKSLKKTTSLSTTINKSEVDLPSYILGDKSSESIFLVIGNMTHNMKFEEGLSRGGHEEFMFWENHLQTGLQKGVSVDNHADKLDLADRDNEKLTTGIIYNSFQDTSNSNAEVENNLNKKLLFSNDVFMENESFYDILSTGKPVLHDQAVAIEFGAIEGSSLYHNEFLQPNTIVADKDALKTVTLLNSSENVCVPVAAILHSIKGLNKSAKTSSQNNNPCGNLGKVDSLMMTVSLNKDSTISDVAENQADTECCSLQLPRPERSRGSPLMTLEVVQRLHYVLTALLRQHPESLPFLMPVDPILQKVPNYFDIIKKPMDLQTISEKLLANKYVDPWQFIEDVWLMFENAWKFNPKKNKVYEYCTKLSEVFVVSIDREMKLLGYCCGQRYKYNPEVITCSASGCCIVAYSTYFHYKNFKICKTCYTKSTTDYVKVEDEDIKEIRYLKKKSLARKTNNTQKIEPFIKCINCLRKFHQICVMYLKSIVSVFICKQCCVDNKIEPIKNHYTSANLKATYLSEYMEGKVNNYLRGNEAGSGVIRIRVVSDVKKICTAQNLMKEVYEENRRAFQFPYREKFILAFQEVNGAEYCFFALQVQEYGSECPEPNNRRVYISYIDSVHFFHPRSFRTNTYHEILLAYIEQRRQLGYKTVHVWACPPTDGGEYIFYSHPPEQKVPRVRKLTEWYKTLFSKGIERRIVKQYQSIVDDNITSVVQIPYFDGDLWPGVLEEIIQETSQKKLEVSLKERAENDFRKKQEKMNALCSRFLSKYKNTVLTVILEEVNTPQTYDTDSLVESEIARTRDSFILKEREMLLEFSSLRRARFSTMCLTYEFSKEREHKQIKCKFCKTYVACCFCPNCDDFQLCFTCTRNVSHQHKLQKIPQSPIKLNLRQGLNSLMDPLNTLEHIYYSYQKQ